MLVCCFGFICLLFFDVVYCYVVGFDVVLLMVDVTACGCLDLLVEGLFINNVATCLLCYLVF